MSTSVNGKKSSHKTILLYMKNPAPHPVLYLDFSASFLVFICMSRSIRHMPYGDNTYFSGSGFNGCRAVPLCTVAAVHPGDAGFKKKFFFF